MVTYIVPSGFRVNKTRNPKYRKGIRQKEMSRGYVQLIFYKGHDKISILEI